MSEETESWDMDINELGLSCRPQKLMILLGIRSVGELAVLSRYDIFRHIGIGEKSLYEIQRKLDEIGLKLGMKNEETYQRGKALGKLSETIFQLVREKSDNFMDQFEIYADLAAFSADIVGMTPAYFLEVFEGYAAKLIVDEMDQEIEEEGEHKDD